MKLFNVDGPFQTYGTKLFNIIALNLFFILMTVFSFGLLFPFAIICLSNGAYECVVEDGFSVSHFFSPFKELKKKFSTYIVLPLLISLLCVIALFNLYNVFMGYITMIWLIPVYFFLLFELLLISLYAIPLALKTNMKFKEIFKLSFVLGNKHFPTSILCIALIIVSIIITSVGVLLPLFILPSILAALINYFIVKRIFPKYDLSAYQDKNPMYYDEDIITLPELEEEHTEK